MNPQKHIRLDFAPREQRYVGRLASTDEAGKVTPLTDWVAFDHDLERAKSEAVSQFGKHTFVVTRGCAL